MSANQQFFPETRFLLYEGINIKGGTGLTEAQNATLKPLGAIL
ncbi:hypothetical protein [Microseira wollei]|nr:hypothetical protein [Microseira wollei]